MTLLPSPTSKTAPTPAVTPPPSAFDHWDTKVFEIKYVDPEQLQSIFSGRSFVMEVNRELKTLTAHGTPAFLKEVEATVQRFDVPPPPPANFQITVYLLTVAAQAPSGTALPADLTAVGKELTGTATQALRLADSQMLRLREGQSGETAGVNSPDSASLTRTRIKNASATPGKGADIISLNGLQIWLNLPAGASPGSSSQKTDPDVSADIDIPQNQPVIVSKAGLDKPVVVLVRATVAH